METLTLTGACDASAQTTTKVVTASPANPNQREYVCLHGKDHDGDLFYLQLSAEEADELASQLKSAAGRLFARRELLKGGW